MRTCSKLWTQRWHLRYATAVSVEPASASPITESHTSEPVDSVKSFISTSTNLDVTFVNSCGAALQRPSIEDFSGTGASSAIISRGELEITVTSNCSCA